MCRRRFFKSYLYIEYGGIKYKNGETVSVSPFLAEGNTTSIVLDSARPWNITNNISWLTVSSSSNKSGTYTITLTAAANQSYDGRSGSFTAKTLDDRYSIVVSVSQEPKASENYIYVTPKQITLDAEDTYDALNCDFYHNGQSPVPVTPVWSTESDAISISADGVVTSNNQTAQAYTNIEVWAKYIYEGDELWDSMKVNVNAASIQRFITVSPQSVSMGATGTQQLTVIYHEIINGHETTTDVTNPSDYSSNSQVITVNGTGLISANNQSEDPATATITVTYDSVPSVNVPVTANSASVEYRNLRVEPSEMSLGSSDVENGKLVHAYVDEYINGQPTGVVIEVTSAATWNSNHTDVATVTATGNNETIKPVYGSGYFPDERNATITGSYLGMTDTCEVTVEPEGYIEQYITVTPSTTSITSTGAVQLVVKLITKTDGVITGEETVTNDASYDENSPLINVNSTGYVTATGSETGGTAIVTISYPGVDDIQATINVQGASVDEYLEITPASTSTTWNGQVTYEVFYVKEVNGQKTSTKITDANVLRFDLSVGTVGDMNGFVFEAENISTAYTDEEISVTCTAGTYNGLSTRTPAELRVNGASSVVYRLDVEAVPSTIPYSGTSQLRASAVTVVNGSVYDWYAPSDVVWSENSTALTINGSTATGTHTGTGATDVTVTGTSQSFGQSGTATIRINGRPEGKLTIRTDTEYVVDSGAGTCNYYISWAYLKPGTTIVLSDSNLESFSPTSIAITNSNYTGGSVTVSADYEENPSQSQRDLYLYGTATTYYNETKTDDDYYRQNGQHVPSITHDLVVTPNLTNESYSGTNQYTATYITLVDGVRDTSQDVDVTDSAVWSIENTGGVFTVLEVDEGYTEWVNLGTGGTAPTVRVSATYGGYSDYDDFTVAKLNSLTATLEVLPATTSVTYNDDVVYTLVLTIKHNGTTVYTKTIDGTSAADRRFTITADTEFYYKSNETQFINQNTGNTDITATVTATFEESSALYLPDGTVVEGTATAELLKEVVLTGWIRWDKKSENIQNNGEFEDVASISWGNLDTNYPIVISSTYLDPDPTNIPNTASTGEYGKSDMHDLISFSGNTGGVRTVIVSASCYDLAGNLVYDVLTTQQDGGYVPPYVGPKVWIASDTTSASFENNSDSAITIEGFSVYIDNTLDFDVTASSRVINANSTRSLTGSLTGYTGTSSYQITVSWCGDYHNDNTTTIYWDETVNGVTYHRQYTLDSFETSTDIYYITGDTELSNFVVEMTQVEPDTPPSDESWVTFTDEPIIFRNDCNQPIYCQSVDLKLNVGGTLYSLTYANDYADELVPIGSEITLFPLGTIPDKIKKTTNISASISYVYIHVTSREGTGIPIAADEEAGFVGNGIGGNNFEIYISGSDPGQMIFDGYEGMGSVTPGHNGYIFNPDGEVTCFVQHNF